MVLKDKKKNLPLAFIKCGRQERGEGGKGGGLGGLHEWRRTYFFDHRKKGKKKSWFAEREEAEKSISISSQAPFTNSLK